MNQPEIIMKFVGFSGIFKESFKTIFSYKKLLFTQITLTLILPLAIIFLAHIHISYQIFSKIETAFIFYPSIAYFENIKPFDWFFYWLFKITYLTFLTVFSLLSTAAVVFTIASVYTGRDVTIRNVIKIVPKIWNKLFATFAFIYFAVFLYNVAGTILVFVTVYAFGYKLITLCLLIAVFIAYVLGFLFLSVIWQLSSVVTVMENICGLKAMDKGKELAYGKHKLGMAIAFVLYVILFGLLIVYKLFVEYGNDFASLKMIWRVMIGILCAFFVMILFLMIMVTQTILYLVCKSYHRESIDKLSLATYLGAYIGEPVVVSEPDQVQLGSARV